MSSTAQHGDIANVEKVVYCCPELRWKFARKVYGKQWLPFFLGIVLAACVSFIKPLYHFFLDSTTGLIVFIVMLLIPFTLPWPIHLYRKNKAVGYFLLPHSTVAYAFALGVASVMEKERIVVEIVVLMNIAFLILDCYTYWAQWRSHNHGFWIPFICCVLPLGLVIVIIIQTGVFPGLGTHKNIKDLFVWPQKHNLVMMEIGLSIAILFSALLIYNTNKVMERYRNNDYMIWPATIYLYLFFRF